MNTVNKTTNVTRLFSVIGLVLLSIMVLSSCSKDDDGQMEVKKVPVVMVHGAWQASYAWEEVENQLTAQGYQVNVLNLKGHGEDNTPVNELSFSGYVAQVKEVINSFNEPVILIGHSLGGAVITQTAAEIPAKIGKLIYVAGFIPQSGKSVLDYAGIDKASLLGPVLEFSADQTLAGVTNPGINFPKVFIQDGTDKQQKFVLDHYRAEPVIPLATPLKYTTDNYTAAGKKYYVFTTADNAISYPFQQQMAKDAGITRTFTTNSGHSPFISKPSELTSILENIIKD